MKVVLDTNVLVSGLLTPFGTCGKIVRMLTEGAFVLCVDARILLEYEDVLRRPTFAIDERAVEVLMEYVRSSAESYGCAPLASPLPDDDDSPFLEIALSSGADCLVTGNIKHFPKRCSGKMPVLSPQQFIEKTWERRTSR